MRTVGDDIESFMLILLWLSARYVKNGMNEKVRGAFLDQFDTMNKATMLQLGVGTVERLELEDQNLGRLLARLMVPFSRYTKVSYLRSEEEAEELQAKCKMVETHEWMLSTLGAALASEVWKKAPPVAAEDQPFILRYTPAQIGEKRQKTDVSVYAERKKRKGHNPGDEFEEDEVESGY